MSTSAGPNEAWHYPPELVELTVKAVSLLNKGKEAELDFFRGAGVPRMMLADLEQQVAIDRNAISKAEIARRVITRLNNAGDRMIGPRREILNRIVRTESFEQCWPDDRLPAKGVVAEIRDVVNKRDSFTRMKQERDRERDERIRASREAAERRERERAVREQVKRDLFALFVQLSPYKRAKALESVLNRLFALDGLGVREAFHVVGESLTSGGESSVKFSRRSRSRRVEQSDHLGSARRLSISARALVGGAVIAFGLSMLALTAFGEDDETGDPRRASLPPSLEKKLAAIARTTARQLGDPNPKAAVVYVTRRLRVLDAIDAGRVDSNDRPVYAIVIEGTFASGRRRPPDAGPAATGRFSITLLDVETLKPLNWSLRDEWSDDGQFGTPIQLPL